MAMVEDNNIDRVAGEPAEQGDQLSSYFGKDERRKGLPLLLSRLISTVMSPLVMPLFAVLVLLYFTKIGFIPQKMKLYYTLVILLNTCVVPILCIGLLHSLGVIKGVLLGSRRDRVLPLFITAVCYVICAFMVSRFYGSFMVMLFLLAGAACIFLAFVVTFYWKISIHMLAAGGTLAMMVVIQYLHIADFLPVIIFMIAACGALASARLYLGAHTPLQVTAGFCGGFLVGMGTLLLGLYIMLL